MTSDRRSRLSRAALVGTLLWTAETATSQGWPQVALVKKLSGFSKPVHVTNAGDGSGRLFVVEQQGRIRIVKNGALLSEPFLDISDRVSCCGERGVLSVAFPPGFPGPGLYVDYTDLNGDTVISRFFVSQTNPDVADARGEEVILHIAQPFANHNGGQLAFGPDGYLYIGMGDGGSEGDPLNNAQNPASLLGKILRIGPPSGSPIYFVPPSNPFVGQPGWRPEIWALGLRNPWRFSFDRKTGDLYIADVGQDTREEVDFQAASSAGGENYGWRIMEGTACYNPPNCNPAGLVFPVTDYTHSGGDCAVTGGFVYRGLSYAGLEGIYLYGDYCTGRIRGLRRRATGWETHEFLTAGFSLSTFGEDERGEVYLVDYGGGLLYQLVDASGPSTSLTVPVVVDVVGAGGSRFTSELTLTNRGTTPVSFDLTYTPAETLGASGGGTISEAVDTGRQTTIPDAIAYLRQKGLEIPSVGDQGGAVQILAKGASSGDAVFASVRTTTPSGPGRAGLAYPALRTNETALSPVTLFGLREDAAFRSNLALVNAVDPAQASSVLLKVTLTSGDPADVRSVSLSPVRLAAGQWLQLNHVLTQAGMSNGWATVERVSGTDPFYAYAVVNDNVTNDGFFVPPVPVGRKAAVQMIPVAASTGGFSTEAVLANPGTEPLTLRLGYSSSNVTLQPGEQRFIPDLISFLGPSLEGPARGVTVRTVFDVPALFFAGARTAATAPGGGSYGLFYPAVAPAEASRVEAWVYGLARNGGVRSNLAIANVDPPQGGPSGSGYFQSLSVDIFDGDTGLLAGSVPVSLYVLATDWKQINSILGPFGIENGYARARVVGTGGYPGSPFLAYGVVNDGAVPGTGTSDGSYLPMVVSLPPSPFPQ